MRNKNINDISLFRYLFELDNRDFPKSIRVWLKNIGSRVNVERETAINGLYELRSNCRNLVILSKTFVDAMDKYYMKFTQFHIDILNELDNESGIIRSPYFIDGCYVVYHIKTDAFHFGYFKMK